MPMSKFFPIIPSMLNNLKWISLTDALLVYGGFFILPNATEQKRINNLSEDSRKALEILTDEIKTEFDKLFLRCTTEQAAEKEGYCKIVKLDGPLLAALRKLENMLQMLPPDISTQTPIFISKLIKIIKESKNSPETAAEELLNQLDKNWKKKNELSFEKFKTLEDNLRKIHNMHGAIFYPFLESNKESKIQQWWMKNKVFVVKLVEFIFFYIGVNVLISLLMWVLN